MAFRRDLSPEVIAAYANVPALLPPPGVTPDFDYMPPTRDAMLAFAGVFLFITSLAVAARIYTKAFLVKCLHPEDYLLVISWGFYVAFLGMVIAQAMANGGNHQWNVRLLDMPHTIWLEWMSTIMYGFMICFAKWALFLLMQRIFSLAKKDVIWWFIQTLIVLNIVFWTGAVVAQMFLCIPFQKIWLQFEIEGTCYDPNIVFILSAAWNMMMDLIILVIPLAMIPRLPVSKGLKGRLIAVFLLGACACIASGLRIWFAVKLKFTDDRTYTIVESIWTASLEHFGVILVICSPSFPKLWKNWRGLPSSIMPSSGSHSMTLSNRMTEQNKWIELQRTQASGVGKKDKEPEWQMEQPPRYTPDSAARLSSIGRALSPTAEGANRSASANRGFIAESPQWVKPGQARVVRTPSIQRNPGDRGFYDPQPRMNQQSYDPESSSRSPYDPTRTERAFNNERTNRDFYDDPENGRSSRTRSTTWYTDHSGRV